VLLNLRLCLLINISYNFLVNLTQFQDLLAAGYHFSKDAANAPDIDRSGVMLTAEKYFWGPVPQRHHLGTIQTPFHFTAF